MINVLVSKVEVHNIPVGSYPVRVMGVERGQIEVTETGIELDNADAHPAGTAEAYYEQQPMREIFRVRVANVPEGAYELFVGGIRAARASKSARTET